MDSVVKITLFILLALILLSLARGLFFLGRDDKEQDRTRMVRALTVRIALSLLLFVLVMGAFLLGWIGPGGR